MKNSKNIHGTSVAIENNGILIIGKSGKGKSDLALRLIDSGATLIADDITVCVSKKNKIFLYPDEQIKGIIEIRGVGLMKVQYIEGIELKLVIDLNSKNLDRLPKKSEKKNIMGIKLPIIFLSAKEASAVAKVKFKLYEEYVEK